MSGERRQRPAQSRRIARSIAKCSGKPECREQSRLADRSLGTPYDPRTAEPEEWRPPSFNATDYFNEGWWRLLFRDPAFRSRYAARFKALLNGEFSADNLERIVDRMALEVGDAAGRNFRRWTQFPPRDNSHAAEIALLKDFLRRRVAWIKAQLDTGF